MPTKHPSAAHEANFSLNAWTETPSTNLLQLRSAFGTFCCDTAKSRSRRKTQLVYPTLRYTWVHDTSRIFYMSLAFCCGPTGVPSWPSKRSWLG